MSFARTSLVLAAAVLALTAAPAVAADPVTDLIGDLTTIRVQCDIDDRPEVVLGREGATYELRGTCGRVRVTADEADVTMPTATHLIVEGTGNVVRTKALGILEVRGTDQQVSPTSVRTLVLGGSGNAVRASGLVSDATITGHHDLLTARELITARVRGNVNRLSTRLLDVLRVPGDRNRVTVTEGRTRVSVTGDGNRISVHRRA